MNNTRRSSKLLAAATASALVFAACGSDDGDTVDDTTGDETETTTGDEAATTDAPEDTTGDEAATTDAPVDTTGEEAAATPGDGNTLIWAHEQEPPDLHLDDPNNNLTITSNIRAALIEGLFGISGATEYYP